jgi:hypothetical protein
MKDLHNHISVESILDPIAVSATAQFTDIDLADFNSAELLIGLGLDAGIGLDGSNKFDLTLSDSSDGDTYTAVEAKDMLGVTPASGVILTVDDPAEDNVLHQFGYVGGKRYLQLDVTVTGTVSCPISIDLIKGDPRDSPAI